MPTPDEPLLDLGTRRRVYRYVEQNPGMHLRGIQRGLDMPLGTVEYHLHQMEKNDLLVTRDDGRFKAFFVKEGIDRRDKDVLYYVRQENPRRIMIHLLENPGSSHSQIAAALPVGPSTVSFHLSKLDKAGLVRQQRQGRSKHFFVIDPDRTASVLVRYRKSFLDDLVDRFAGAWMGMTPAEPDLGATSAQESDKEPPQEPPTGGPPVQEPDKQEPDKQEPDKQEPDKQEPDEERSGDDAPSSGPSPRQPKPSHEMNAQAGITALGRLARFMAPVRTALGFGL